MKNALQKVLDFISDSKQPVAEKKITPPVLNKKKCTGCGLCVTACAARVIHIVEDKAEIHLSGDIIDCVECGHCVAICPVGAIKDPLAEASDNRPFKASDLPSAASLQMLFRSRRSMRHYMDKPIPREVLEKIINAARFSPAGGNKTQDVNYLVITSPEKVAAFRGPVLESVIKLFSMLSRKSVQTAVGLIMGKDNVDVIVNYIPVLEYFREQYDKHDEDLLFFKAPAMILVHGEKFNDIIAFGSAVALHQAVLMAQTLKVGSCYNGFLQEAINRDAKIKKMFGIPKNHKCYGAMTLGYSRLKYKRLVRRPPSPVVWR